MGDWGLANGPNDKRSHADMMMQSQIRKGNNPNDPCPNCGADFKPVPEDEEDPPKSIRHYECTNCDNFTYDWREGYEPSDPDYTWDDE